MIQQAFTHRKQSWCPHKVHPWHSGSHQPKPLCSACWGPGFAASAQRCSHGWLVAEWWSAAASFPRWIQNWPGRSPASGKTASTGRVWPCWMDSRFAEAAEGWFDQRMRNKVWGNQEGSGGIAMVVQQWLLWGCGGLSCLTRVISFSDPLSSLSTIPMDWVHTAEHWKRR